MKMNWDTYHKIRELINKNISYREISRRLGIHRKTVVRYARGQFTPDDKIKRVVTPTEKSEEVNNLIIDYKNKYDKFSFGKQKITYSSIYRAIQNKVSVSYSTVARYCKNIFSKENISFIPLIFEAGDVMQIDWFLINLYIQNVLVNNLPVFAATLPFSGMFFCMIMPNMTFNSFTYGHVQAFKFFGGVTKRIFYDNLKTAVKSGAGSHALIQKNFQNFSSHYGFEPVFMNANAGNEKGHVENYVKTSRGLLYTPVPSITNLEDFHNQNLSKIINYANNHKINRNNNTIMQNFLLEQQQLFTLPVKDYLPFSSKNCIVNKFSLIQDNTSKYSVPDKYIGEEVTIINHPYNIEIWHKGICIADHAISLISNSINYDPHHYMDSLSKKKRAIRNAAPLSQGKLTPEMSEFVDKSKPMDRNKLIYDLLRIEQKYGPEVISTELTSANFAGITTLNQLYSIIKIKYTPVNDIKIDDDDKVDIPQRLHQMEVGCDPLDDYDSLISGELDNRQPDQPDNGHGGEDDHDV